jgi:hypothetical protein
MSSESVVQDNLDAGFKLYTKGFGFISFFSEGSVREKSQK